MFQTVVIKWWLFYRVAALERLHCTINLFISEPTLRIEPENINVITGGVARFQCQIESASPKAPFCVWEHPRQDSQINRSVFMLLYIECSLVLFIIIMNIFLSYKVFVWEIMVRSFTECLNLKVSRLLKIKFNKFLIWIFNLEKHTFIVKNGKKVYILKVKQICLNSDPALHLLWLNSHCIAPRLNALHFLIVCF
jgi:hypothetical protein